MSSIWDIQLGTVDCQRADTAADRINEYMGGKRTVFKHPDRIRLSRLSSRAELGLSILLGLPWSGERLVKNGRHTPDVGNDIEVRWTSYQPHSPLLMLQERDRVRRDSRFVLATGEDVIQFRGWAYGWEVMRPENYRPEMPYPCFALPVAALWSMNDL